eukprot:3768236-Rhodomonas_salina.1
MVSTGLRGADIVAYVSTGLDTAASVNTGNRGRRYCSQCQYRPPRREIDTLRRSKTPTWRRTIGGATQRETDAATLGPPSAMARPGVLERERDESLGAEEGLGDRRGVLLLLRVHEPQRSHRRRHQDSHRLPRPSLRALTHALHPHAAAQIELGRARIHVLQGLRCAFEAVALGREQREHVGDDGGAAQELERKARAHDEEREALGPEAVLYAEQYREHSRNCESELLDLSAVFRSRSFMLHAQRREFGLKCCERVIVLDGRALVVFASTRAHRPDDVEDSASDVVCAAQLQPAGPQQRLDFRREVRAGGRCEHLKALVFGHVLVELQHHLTVVQAGEERRAGLQAREDEGRLVLCASESSKRQRVAIAACAFRRGGAAACLGACSFDWKGIRHADGVGNREALLKIHPAEEEEPERVLVDFRSEHVVHASLVLAWLAAALVASAIVSPAARVVRAVAFPWREAGG